MIEAAFFLLGGVMGIVLPVWFRRQPRCSSRFLATAFAYPEHREHYAISRILRCEAKEGHRAPHYSDTNEGFAFTWPTAQEIGGGE